MPSSGIQPNRVREAELKLHNFSGMFFHGICISSSTQLPSCPITNQLRSEAEGALHACKVTIYLSDGSPHPWEDVPVDDEPSLTAVQPAPPADLAGVPSTFPANGEPYLGNVAAGACITRLSRAPVISGLSVGGRLRQHYFQQGCWLFRRLQTERVAFEAAERSRVFPFLETEGWGPSSGLDREVY